MWLSQSMSLIIIKNLTIFALMFAIVWLMKKHQHTQSMSCECCASDLMLTTLVIFMAVLVTCLWQARNDKWINKFKWCAGLMKVYHKKKIVVWLLILCGKSYFPLTYIRLSLFQWWGYSVHWCKPSANFNFRNLKPRIWLHDERHHESSGPNFKVHSYANGTPHTMGEQSISIVHLYSVSHFELSIYMWCSSKKDMNEVCEVCGDNRHAQLRCNLSSRVLRRNSTVLILPMKKSSTSIIVKSFFVASISMTIPTKFDIKLYQILNCRTWISK